jgi:hypothetical protein
VKRFRVTLRYSRGIKRSGLDFALELVLPSRENLNVDHILVVGGRHLVELLSWIGEFIFESLKFCLETDEGVHTRWEIKMVKPHR